MAQIYEDPFIKGRPTWLPSIDEYRTPQEHWESFAAAQQPFWSTRAPLTDVAKNLQARYALSTPYRAQEGTPTDFGRFLQDYTGGWGGAQGVNITQRPGIDELRERATEAAMAATQPSGQYLDPSRSGLNLNTPEGLAEWNKRAWYVSQFGPGATGASANQRAVANLFALQRPGGGVYRGQMADAIRNAMERLQQHRINIGAPRETFLSYILGGGQGGIPPRTTSENPYEGTDLYASNPLSPEVATNQYKQYVPPSAVPSTPFVPVNRTMGGTITPTAATSPASTFSSYVNRGDLPDDQLTPTELAARRNMQEKEQQATVEASSPTYQSILGLLPDPFDALEAAKRDAGMPYNTILPDGRRGGMHVPTMEEAQTLAQEQPAPQRTQAPPTETRGVDQYGYRIPIGSELSEKDEERSRMVREYMAQGMDYQTALKLVNENLWWRDVASGAVEII